MTLMIFAAALAAHALSLPTATATAAPAASAEERMHHISVTVEGSGPPVVLIPGLSSPRAVWDALLPDLARSHSVYRVQVNGFGGDAPGRNLEGAILDGIVAELGARLERDRAGPVRLVGHSLGGLVALKFAHGHAGQVDRVMVIDALPYFPALMTPGTEPPGPAMIEPVARAYRDRVAARFGKPVDLPALGAGTDRLARKPESQARIREWAAAADPRVTAQLLYEDMITDLRPALSSIAVPVSVVYPWAEERGSQERTLAFYKAQYAGAPRVRYVGIAEAGHFLMLDQPGAFKAALLDFLGEPEDPGSESDVTAFLPGRRR